MVAGHRYRPVWYDRRALEQTPQSRPTLDEAAIDCSRSGSDLKEMLSLSRETQTAQAQIIANRQAQYDRARETLRAVVGKTRSADEFWQAEVEPAVREANETFKAFVDHYQTLAALDQLFIAV
jgi:hypothetical protein